MTPKQEIKQNVQSMTRDELQLALLDNVRYLTSIHCNTLRNIIEEIETIKWAENYKQK